MPQEPAPLPASATKAGALSDLRKDAMAARVRFELPSAQAARNHARALRRAGVQGVAADNFNVWVLAREWEQFVGGTAEADHLGDAIRAPGSEPLECLRFAVNNNASAPEHPEGGVLVRFYFEDGLYEAGMEAGEWSGGSYQALVVEAITRALVGVDRG